MYESLALLSAIVFVYSAIAGRVERSIITGPILFIGIGLLVGPFGFNILDSNIRDIELRVVADVTLALLLFIEAANADLGILRSRIRIPWRMLVIGMPLVIALGVVTGWVLFPDVSIWEICILATMLAATDAALGKGVVTNKDVPAHLRVGAEITSHYRRSV